MALRALPDLGSDTEHPTRAARVGVEKGTVMREMLTRFFTGLLRKLRVAGCIKGQHPVTISRLRREPCVRIRGDILPDGSQRAHRASPYGLTQNLKAAFVKRAILPIQSELRGGCNSRCDEYE